jgi:L-alanine-DL-glutamate epimerase-like enolase superfamily enzyme
VETFPNAKLTPAWPHPFDSVPRCRDGRVSVLDRPGWGMTINEGFLRKHGTPVHWSD